MQSIYLSKDDHQCGTSAWVPLLLLESCGHAAAVPCVLCSVEVDIPCIVRYSSDHALARASQLCPANPPNVQSSLVT